MNRRALSKDLASRIADIRRDHPVRVAIDGVDASGKTTLADELVPRVRGRERSVVRASLDGFHNPAAVRHRRGAMSAEGYYRDSFNYAALIRDLLQPLGPGGSRRYRAAVFDYRTDSAVNTAFEAAAPDAVLLFDGVFLLRPELREYWDFSIFVHADFEVAVSRAKERDVALFGSLSEVWRRYEQRYVPGQRLYLTEAQPRRWANVVIDNNDPMNPSLERILSQDSVGDG